MAGIYGPSLGHKARPGRILMAGVEGERHALGLRMATDVIELAGYETIYLEADVPTADLLQAVAARSPDLVGLSATMPSSIPTLERTIAEIRRLYPSLIVMFGGQGAQPRGEDGGAVFVRSLEHLLAAVETALDTQASDAEGPSVQVETAVGRVKEVGAQREDETDRAASALPCWRTMSGERCCEPM